MSAPLGRLGEGTDEIRLSLDTPAERTHCGRTRWASVTYELSSGQEAEALVEVDEHGAAEVLIHMEGQPLVHVTTDGSGGTKTWVAPNVSLTPEMLAELAGPAVADEVFAALVLEPLAFPCSDYGKKVLKASKYIWGSMIVAAEFICCSSTGGAGCVACLVGGYNLGEAGSEALENYCA